MLVQAAGLGILGTVVSIAGIAKAKLNDWFLAAAALTFATLIVQIVASIIAPIAGNGPSGDIWEYWTYLITAVVLPPAATIWAFMERGRWSVTIIGIGILAVAVMVYRMHQIWFVQLA